MAYWEKYRKASFRGVEFWPQDGDDEHGRRLVAHEYPQRDQAYTEDLGKKAASYSLRGRVAGEDFLADAQRLVEACNKPGPGVLVHPLLGTLQVVCKDCRANWTLQRKGLVEFSFTFVEEGENRYPAANEDYAELAAERAAASLDAFQDLFTEVLDLQGPGWLADAVLADVAAALAMVAKVVSVAAPGGGAALALDIVAQAQAQATAGVSSSQAAGDILALGLGAITSLARSADAGAALWAAQEISGFGAITGSDGASQYGGTLSEVTGDTPTRQAQAANRAAVTSMVQQLSVTHGIQAALDMDLSSYQEAVRVRDRLTGLLDVLMLAAGDRGDDDAYQALRLLLVDVVAAFEQKGASLPQVASRVVPPAVTSGLAMAYELYGDVGRADELLGRNPQVMHPGFLPSGDELEVLRA